MEHGYVKSDQANKCNWNPRLIFVHDCIKKSDSLLQGTHLYRPVQDKPLKDYLPLGTGVLVNLRRYLKQM